MQVDSFLSARDGVFSLPQLLLTFVGPGVGRNTKEMYLPCKFTGVELWQ